MSENSNEQAIRNGWGWVLGVSGKEFAEPARRSPGYREKRKGILAEIAWLEGLIEARKSGLNDLRSCTCGDSARASIGTCPDRGHREFNHCPKRQAAGADKED